VTEIVYDAAPTIASFMKSAAFGRLLAGPVGSGKTTGCLWEIFRRACEQRPAPDGYRYTRFAIVRQTLKQLRDTVLKDILQWLQRVAQYKVSENTIYIEFNDVRSEWLLIPLEDQEDQRRLLSMQLTGAFMSEAIEMDVGIVAPLAGRCGRYPSAVLGGCTWAGLIADTNMPTEGSEWHTFMHLNISPDWQIFIQPGGLDPLAENLEWLNQNEESLKLDRHDPQRLALGRIYYERLSRNPPDWVKRYVNAQYGDDPSGSAVFRLAFKRSFHVVDELMPVPGHALLVGQDFGRDPWSIICQLDHRGRFNVLEEVAAEDVGLEHHINHALRPALTNARYLGLPIALIGDPAGTARSSIYEETTFDVLKRMGFKAFPAPTNDIDPRLRAVEAFMLAQRDGGPAFRVDKGRCPTVIRALDGGYRYAKTKHGQLKPVPDKNRWSHPMDGLQYSALAAHGGMTTMIGRVLRSFGSGPTGPRVRVGGWT
jgi:hypothetical protein